MKNSKKDSLLLELLKGINEKDFKKIYQLAISGYWKISAKDLALMKRLKQVDEQKRLEIYNDLQEKDNNFKYQKEKMVTLIEDYILLQLCHKKVVLRDSLLAHFYGEKALDKNYRKRIKSYKKNLSNRPLDTDTGFLHYKYYELLTINSKTKRKPIQELSYMRQSLERFLIDNDLRLSVEEINQKNIIGKVITEQKELIPIEYSHTVEEVYQHLYQLIQDENNIHSYNYLKNLILQEKAFLSIDEWKTIYIHLKNYTVQKLNQGIKDYNEDYLLFIELSLSKGYLLQNNLLDHGRYRNIFLTYLIAAPDNLKRAETFLEQYVDSINHPYKDTVKKIHLIYILILKNQYKQAEEYFAEIFYSHLLDLPLQIFYRKLQLMLAYTLKDKSIYDFEPILKNYDSFIRKQYSLRGKNNSQRKTKREICLNFAKLIKRLYLEKLDHSDLQKIPPTTSDNIWFEKKLGRR